jgi:putative flippase GtrA
MKIARQFMAYCGVGIVNTAAGLGIILLLSHVFGWHYMAANAGGYVCGVVISFALNRRFTFRSQGAAGRQFGRFAILLLCAYGVQLVALYGMVEHLHLPEAGAQILAIGLYTLLGFFGSRFLVFSNRSDDP